VQARETGLPGIVCALLVTLALVVPASAGATVRFAAPPPTGMNSGECGTVPQACTLQRAVEVVAVNGDEVIVLPGTYPELADDLVVSGGKYVHGLTGQAYPNVTFTNPAPQGVLLSDTSVLERLSISVTGTSPAALRLTGGTAQQLSVLQQGAGAAACRVEGPALIRDSVCWANAANGVGLLGFADTQAVSAVVRNATIEGTGAPSQGIQGHARNGGTLFVDVKNTIARGIAPSPDVQADTLDGTSTAVVALERSNYATQSETGPGLEFVTDPGTNSNQTTAPALVNRFAGNFHQLPSSPTIDAGASFSSIGSVDIDGDPRTVESASGCISGIARPDIGADELVPGFRDCAAPETRIARGPKGRTRKRRASFELAATEIASFQCSLDERPFSACTTPQVYRKLRTGKHIFTVRAADQAGNVDATPAERVWRVRAKPKRRGPRK
jgi:hypothetical protein